ncbi:helix-turn-helix domain-containing protein [Paenibacillus allorhizosphaerae]|uniref:HTH-type transcriptional activator RhaS n=1 Tax=Paenibacillus allorhizosphaerae TaxID=2849866 RepID=A0ABN7THA3_9BACL|nr:helix-turn-helix domain-containing protein [Paenibacillus allorhizosphaerae]CAG7625678.1 HTH-type transcriptional activator RhaS [Paenibacillus allorhizosphaerae]
MDIHLNIFDQPYKIDHVTTNLMSGRKGRITKTHRHPVFHFIYVTEGRGEFEINGRLSHAEPGYFYIINPNEWHSFSGSEEEPLCDLESTFLLLDACGQPAVLNFFDVIEQGRQVLLPPALRREPLVVPPDQRPLLVEGFQRLIDAKDSFFSHGRLEVMLLDLLTRSEEIIMRMNSLELVEPPHSLDSVHTTASKLKSYLHTCVDKPVTLRELANTVHLTPNYLCRLFKEYLGETPMGYLQRLRLQEARRLLTHTDLPVSVISEKLCYEEPSYFARLFRKRYGISPTDYRRARWSASSDNRLI